MTWMKSLETGVPLIDEQHKELFRRIDGLLQAGKTKEDKGKAVRETLQFLEDYVIKHFRDEENLQYRSAYPKAGEHKKMHDDYVKTIDALSKRYRDEGETLDIVLTVNQTVITWLTNHIHVHDREFAQYYRAKNNG